MLTRLGLYQDVASSRLASRASARKEEPLRRASVRILDRVLSVFGEVVFYELLKLVAYSSKFLTKHDNDLYFILKELGYNLEVSARNFKISGRGVLISYQDDYYYSYTRFLLGPVFDKIPFPLDLMPMEREPNSLKKELLDAGLQVDSVSAQKYLADLHSKDMFPNSLKYRLLGGNYPVQRTILALDSFEAKGSYLYKIKTKVSPSERTAILNSILSIDDDQFTAGVSFDVFPTLVRGLSTEDADKICQRASPRQIKECHRVLKDQLKTSRFSFEKIRDMAHGEGVPDKVLWAYFVRYSQTVMHCVQRSFPNIE